MKGYKGLSIFLVILVSLTLIPHILDLPQVNADADWFFDVSEICDGGYTYSGENTNLVYSEGYWFSFYRNNTDTKLYYASCSDGENWTIQGAVSSGAIHYDFTSWGKNGSSHVGCFYSISNQYYVKVGYPQDDGTISWASQENTGYNSGSTHTTTSLIYQEYSDLWWIAFYDNDPSACIKFATNNHINCSNAWTLVKTQVSVGGTLHSRYYSHGVEASNKTDWVVWFGMSYTLGNKFIYFFSNATNVVYGYYSQTIDADKDQANNVVRHYTLDIQGEPFTDGIDTLRIVCTWKDTEGDLNSLSYYHNGTNQFSSQVQLYDGTDVNCPTISINRTGVFHSWFFADDSIYHRTSTDWGATWNVEDGNPFGTDDYTSYTGLQSVPYMWYGNDMYGGVHWRNDTQMLSGLMYQEYLEPAPTTGTITFYFNPNGIFYVNGTETVNGTSTLYNLTDTLTFLGDPYSPRIFDHYDLNGTSTTTENPHNYDLTGDVTIWLMFGDAMTFLPITVTTIPVNLILYISLTIIGLGLMTSSRHIGNIVSSAIFTVLAIWVSNGSLLNAVTYYTGNYNATSRVFTPSLTVTSITTPFVEVFVSVNIALAVICALRVYYAKRKG